MLSQIEMQIANGVKSKGGTKEDAKFMIQQYRQKEASKPKTQLDFMPPEAIPAPENNTPTFVPPEPEQPIFQDQYKNEGVVEQTGKSVPRAILDTMQGIAGGAEQTGQGIHNVLSKTVGDYALYPAMNYAREKVLGPGYKPMTSETQLRKEKQISNVIGAGKESLLGEKGFSETYNQLNKGDVERYGDQGLVSDVTDMAVGPIKTAFNTFKAPLATGLNIASEAPGTQYLMQAFGKGIESGVDAISETTGLDKNASQNIVEGVMLGMGLKSKGGTIQTAKNTKLAYNQGGGGFKGVSKGGLQVAKDTLKSTYDMAKMPVDIVKGGTKAIIKTPEMIRKGGQQLKQVGTNIRKNIKEKNIKKNEPVIKLSKVQKTKNQVASQLLASDWKLNKSTRDKLKNNIGENGPEFALKNNLVGRDVETTANNASKFKISKMREKKKLVDTFGDTKTPEVMKNMSEVFKDKIVADVKKSYKLKDEAQVLEKLQKEHPEFAQVYKLLDEIQKSDKIQYSKLEQMKELYDLFNPENIKYDVAGKAENTLANQLVVDKRAKLQKLIENKGLEKGIDIKQINKDIKASHELQKGLNNTIGRKENLNIFGLGDMQTSIIGAVMGGPTAALGGLLGKKIINSESFKGNLAKKLYTKQKKNVLSTNTKSANNSNSTSSTSRVGRIMNTDSIYNNVNKPYTKSKTLALPAPGKTTKGKPIITPQTVDKGIISESKKGLKKGVIKEAKVIKTPKATTKPVKEVIKTPKKIEKSKNLKDFEKTLEKLGETKNKEKVLKDYISDVKKDISKWEKLDDAGSKSKLMKAKQKTLPQLEKKLNTFNTIKTLTKDNITTTATKIAHELGAKTEAVVKVIKDFMKKHGEDFKNKLGELVDEIADKTGTKLNFMGKQSSYAKKLNLSQAGKPLKNTTHLKTEIQNGMHDKLLKKVFDIKQKSINIQAFKKNAQKEVQEIVDYFPKTVNSLSQFKKELKVGNHSELLDKIDKLYKKSERMELYNLIKKPNLIK